MSVDTIRAIVAVRTGLDFSEEAISTEELTIAINAIQSKAITHEEQALGHFTRRKLKKMDTSDKWEAGECKQLNQLRDLQMYGASVVCLSNAIVLRPHWQYHVKRCGTRHSGQCCDGSRHAAPLLYALVLTCSSCVEHPVQRLFLAISANEFLKIYGGDAKDTFAHSPAPDVPTFVIIDDLLYHCPTIAKGRIRYDSLESRHLFMYSSS